MAKKRTKKNESPVRGFLTQGGKIVDFTAALDAAGRRPPAKSNRSDKKNYAQYLSEAIAVLIANKLRPAFPEILPRSDGTGLESKARTGKGVKKLDVNYSTPQLGLGLGISIKTLNYRDPRSKRYTKNPTRLDNELRAEAMDYHQRQPYAVMIGIVYVPWDSCEDGNPERPKQSRSSFAQIVNVLRHRGDRAGATDDTQLFESIFVGLYGYEDPVRGKVRFFDASLTPPQFGYPSEVLLIDLDALLSTIVGIYDGVNVVRPAWDTTSGKTIVSLDELLEIEAIPDDDDEGGEVDF